MARIVVFLSSAPGAGKTRRLRDEERRLKDAGKTVVHDPDVPSADLPDVVMLDDLALNERWQAAMSLRDRGVSVVGAFEIAQLETLVPFSFLEAADDVIALDASPELFIERLKRGKIVGHDDIAESSRDVYNPETLERLRNMLLQTIDRLTVPQLRPEQSSTAAAYILEDTDRENFLRRTKAVASALDLAMNPLQTTAAEFLKVDIQNVRASLLAVPAGMVATKLASRRIDRDLFIVGKGQTYIGESPLVSHPYGLTAGDRMRVGYGKLVIYFGAAPGCGKTYAMLDRARQMREIGVDVVAGVVETHGRAETQAQIGELELLPLRDGELDRSAVISRKPEVVLIDDIAHVAPNNKRFDDVLAILRAGVSVITTLDVEHLEALSDSVYRLTGLSVRDTVTDGVLGLADEIILVDATPQILRDRLEAGKIVNPEQIQAELHGFFRIETLKSMRQLLLRELLHARDRQRIPAPFERLLLSVAARAQDLRLITRCSRIAARLEVPFAVAHVTETASENPAVSEALEAAAHRERATWIREVDKNVAGAVLRIARSTPETTIAVAGTLRTPSLFARKTFARQLLDQGARELLVLAPRGA